MSACDVPFSVARLLGPLLVLGWPEPARAPELRRMQGAGDARLTVEPKGSVGVDCGARGRSVRAEWSRAGARLMLLVVLVNDYDEARRGGAPPVSSGSVDVNGTPDGSTRAGTRAGGAAVARGGCASRGEEGFGLRIAGQSVIRNGELPVPQGGPG